jgi:hypothetical protein
VGNEYVYQNMSDEEKRIKKEQEQEIMLAEKERLKTEKEVAKLKGREREDGEKSLDGEKKRLAEEKQKQEEERKNKVAEIVRVGFLDKDSKEKNVFKTGDDLLIRVYFNNNKSAKILNFGLAIFNQEGVYISGVNTFLDKIDTTKYIKNGYFDVLYHSINLGEGTYYIKSGIWGKDIGHLIDFLTKSNSFKVFKKNRNDGIFHLEYIWQ